MHQLRPRTLHITQTSHTHKLQIYHIHAKQTNKQMPPIHKGKLSKTPITDFKVLYNLVPLQSPALFSSVQFNHSVMSDSLRPHESQHARPPLSITNSQSSLRLTSIKPVMPSSHLVLCCPLLLLPPIPPSIRVFSNESTLRMRWPKY